MDASNIDASNTPDEHLNTAIANLVFTLPSIYHKTMMGIEVKESVYNKLLQTYYEVLFLVDGHINITSEDLRLDVGDKEKVVEHVRLFISRLQNAGIYNVGVYQSGFMQ